VAVIKVTEPYPPSDDWIPVFVTWERMLEHRPSVQDILYWAESAYEGYGQYQLRGAKNWNEANKDGFVFYFEDVRDAEIFILTWGCDHQ
jgi:hypothetical protein